MGVEVRPQESFASKLSNKNIFLLIAKKHKTVGRLTAIWTIKISLPVLPIKNSQRLLLCQYNGNKALGKLLK